MEGKYQSTVRFALVRSQRALLRAALRPLVRWSPLNDACDGYTIVIGCRSDLIPLLRANLITLQRQDQMGLHRIILVIDAPVAVVPRLATTLRSEFRSLPLDFVFYSTWQHRFARWINWAWVYSWMSWSLGIASSQTRHVILHDLDAMLIRNDILRERFEAITTRGHQFIGERYYHGNGVDRNDHLASTYELVLDATFLRSRFQPIDLFNHVTRVGGRSIDYDTLLWVQTQAGESSVLPIDADDMMHPSQMICQYTELVERGIQPERQPNLPMIPYFYSVGGDTSALTELTQMMAESADGSVAFFGRRLDLSVLSLDHALWLRDQSYRLERAVCNSIRPIVSEYFQALLRLAERNDERRRAAA